MVAISCYIPNWTNEIHVVSIRQEYLIYISAIANLIVLNSLEMLDKMEPPTVIEGYGISVAYACLLDIVRSISLAVHGPSKVCVNVALYTIYIFSIAK